MNIDEQFKIKVGLMLQMQSDINFAINNDWKKAGNQWYRAIWTESAEMLDHIGWKWWKKQTSDKFQLHLELIDIWHFGISQLLNKYDNFELIINKITFAYVQAESNRKSNVAEEDLRVSVEDFALETLNTRDFVLKSYFTLMANSDLTFDELFERYVAKNILNKFRQDNGYKNGTYIKIWEDEEDNVWLERFLEKMDFSSCSFHEDIYNQLQIKYDSLVGENSNDRDK
jgi:dUTPase.